jgi:hypothetical protein
MFAFEGPKNPFMWGWFHTDFVPVILLFNHQGVISPAACGGEVHLYRQKMVGSFQHRKHLSILVVGEPPSKDLYEWASESLSKNNSE